MAKQDFTAMAEDYLKNLGYSQLTSSSRDMQNAAKQAEFINKIGTMEETANKLNQEPKDETRKFLLEQVTGLNTAGQLEYDTQIAKGLAPEQALGWAKRTDKNAKIAEGLAKSGATEEQIGEMYDPKTGYISEIEAGNYLSKKENIRAAKSLLPGLVSEESATANRVAKMSDPVVAATLTPEAVLRLEEDKKRLKSLQEQIDEARSVVQGTPVQKNTTSQGTPILTPTPQNRRPLGSVMGGSSSGK